MISKVVFEIKNSIRSWSDQEISFSSKNMRNVSIIIKDIKCELAVDGNSEDDNLQYIKCDIETICIGMAASMGSFLLTGGTKGKRLALPNSEIMIHQPLGGAQGQATEIQIAADHILKTRQKLNQILAENTGQPLEVINADTERDNFMTAEEAKAYGLIDEVIKSR